MIFFLVAICFPALERVIFFSEIFALLGVLSFPIWLRNREYKLNKLEACLALFLCYQIVLLCEYLLIDFRAGLIYGQLRTLTLMYSVFCFYFGAILFHSNGSRFLYIVSKYRIAFLLIIMGSWRVTAVPATALLTNVDKRFNLVRYVAFFLCVFIAGGAFDGHNTLTYFMAVLAFLILFGKKKTLDFSVSALGSFKTLCAFALFAIIVLYYVYWYFQDFYHLGFSYFAIDDVNSLWRLMFWALKASETIEKSLLFGIGFGTPLFDIESTASQFIVNSNPDDEWLPYTLGLHNSFLLVFIRLGAIGLCLLLYILALIIKECRLFLSDKVVHVLTVSFLLLNLGALLNVVLESPLASSLYWILAGGIHGRVMYLKQYAIN